MCNNCTCDTDLKTNVNELKDNHLEPIEISDEDLMAMLNQGKAEDRGMTFITNPYELDEEYLKELAVSDEFDKGVNDSLYWAGLYTGLVGFGLPVEDILAFISNEQTLRHNLEIQKLTVHMNITMAEKGVIASEKNQL